MLLGSPCMCMMHTAPLAGDRSLQSPLLAQSEPGRH